MAIRDNLGSGGGSSRVENGIKQTTAATLANSAKGGVKIVDIFGACKQAADPTANDPQYIGHTRFKNMLQITVPTKENNGITANEISDSYGNTSGIKISGTATALTAISIGTITAQKGSYILSGCPSGGSVSSYWLNVATKGNDTGAGVTLEYGEEETNEVFIYVAEGATVDAMFYPMFRSALAANGDFVPYGAMPIKTKGAQLVNIGEPRTYTTNGITFIVETDESITINGTATATAILQVPARYSAGKELTISAEANIASSCILRFAAPDYSVVTESQMTVNATSKSHTFTLTEETAFFDVRFGKGETANNVNIKFMVNEGNVTLPRRLYAENTSYLPDPVELYGIGSVADSMNFDGITRRFAKVVFDGSEDELWTAQPTKDTAEDGKYRYTTRFLHGLAKGFNIADSANLMCTHYKAVPSNSTGTWGKNEGISIDAAGTLLVYDKNINTSDISLWKAHLAENPIEVVYELADPITEEISAANKKALCNLPSYDGVTYIECDAEITPILEVEYGTSRAGALTLENSNEIALNRLAIQEMGGTV